MAITPLVVADAISDELPKIFNDAVQNERLGQPNYIKDGAPQSIVGQVGQAVARSGCRAYGAGNLNLSPAKALAYENACRPYLEGIAPGGAPGLELPFRGGQCDGAQYIVRYTDEGDPEILNSGIVGTTKVNGPIGGFRSEVVNGSFRTFVTCRGLESNVTCATTGRPPLGALAERFWFQVQDRGYGAGTFEVLQACTVDNCGNLEPEVTDPRPIADPQPPPFRFNPVPGIDIDVDVSVGPTGDITFDIGTGPITVDPFGGGGDGGGGGAAPSTPGTPGGSSDTGAGGAGGAGGGVDGDAPTGKVLTGLRVDILQAPLSRSRFSDEVDRGVAYVYMGSPAEGLALEPTGALVRNGQFFFAQKDYLTRWAVRAKFGYNLRITPYYKDEAA